MEALHRDDKIKITIRDKVWIAHLVDRTTLEKNCGHNLIGQTRSDRHIYFLDSEICMSLIFHEVLHAYVYTLYLSSATNLPRADHEEILVDMLSDQWFEIQLNVFKLAHRWLRPLSKKHLTWAKNLDKMYRKINASY